MTRLFFRTCLLPVACAVACAGPRVSPEPEAARRPTIVVQPVRVTPAVAVAGRLDSLAANLTEGLERVLASEPTLTWLPRDPDARPRTPDGSPARAEFVLAGTVTAARADTAVLEWRLIVVETTATLYRSRERFRADETARIVELVGSQVVPVLAGFTAAPGGDPSSPSDECGPFGNWAASPFVVPYPVGDTYEVNQGNCSGFGHSEFWKHGYDFIMPIGAAVTASRSGRVGWAIGGCRDFDQSCTNLVTIIHDDGLVSVYSHLTQGGALVLANQTVSAGDTIGLSGVSGNTGGLPHLHFSVHPCNELPGLPVVGDCPTIAVNFRNTDPNPVGLIARRSYVAGPH